MHWANGCNQRSDHDGGINPGGLGGLLIHPVCQHKMVTGAKLKKQDIIDRIKS
jgi:hypothetical protein